MRGWVFAFSPHAGSEVLACASQRAAKPGPPRTFRTRALSYDALRAREPELSPTPVAANR